MKRPLPPAYEADVIRLLGRQLAELVRRKRAATAHLAASPEAKPVAPLPGPRRRVRASS